MFKKRNHGIFCYCNICRARRKSSILYNIITSSRSYDDDTLKVIKNFLTFNVSSIIKNK